MYCTVTNMIIIILLYSDLHHGYRLVQLLTQVILLLSLCHFISAHGLLPGFLKRAVLKVAILDWLFLQIQSPDLCCSDFSV